MTVLHTIMSFIGVMGHIYRVSHNIELDGGRSLSYMRAYNVIVSLDLDLFIDRLVTVFNRFVTNTE